MVSFIRLSVLVSTASFFSLSAEAQNLLIGKVIDSETQDAIVGATVYIHDLRKGSVSDLQGNYTIEDLPRGKFLVEFKFLGYSSTVLQVQIEGKSILNISLNSSTTELNEVVVTGISHLTELKNNPTPVTTLNSKALIENSSTNLIDNISQKPGVNQITTGAAVSKPIIRGLGYNRIISLYDGLRQEGQQWGDEHGIEIDEFSVDRVEIIKGAGSLMYGSDGLGGVINFLTANPVSEGSIIGKWSSNYQTNNRLLGNSFVNAGNIKGLYWQARFSNKEAKSYSNAYDGKVFNSGFGEIDFNGFAGLSKAWGYTQFNVSSFNQALGLVEGDRDGSGNFTRLKNVNGNEEEITVTPAELNSYKLFIPMQQISHLRISNTSNFYFGSSRLQLNAGYQRNKRKEFGNVLNENEKSLYFDLQSWNYNFIFFFPEQKGWQFSLGISGMAQQNQNKGIEFLIPEYQSFDWGGFGFFKKHFGKLDLSGGLRFDQRKISIDALYLDSDGNPSQNTNDFQKFKAANLVFSNYSSSVGITYQFSKAFSTKVNASRGFRAPNIAELASNGRHEGTLRYEYGNNNLSPETSFQVDASMLISAKHISAEFSIFQNSISHYIYTQKLLGKNGQDSIPDPSEPVPAYLYGQGKAQLMGGEFTIDFHPHPLDWLHFENGFSFVNAINKNQKSDSSKYLPYIPAPRYQSELRANITQGKSRFASLYVKIEYNYFLKQSRVLLEAGTETETPSYSLWNTGIGTDVVNNKGKKIFSFYFNITNVLDKAYQNHLNRLKYAAENAATGRTGVFNMGRNYSVKIIVPVTFKK